MRDQNYYDAFIHVAEDSKATTGIAPEPKGGKETIASLQYELISERPYRRTQDDVLFEVYAHRNQIPKKELKREREKFFSKGQPCLRTSPLCKIYGWGIHFNQAGQAALHAVDSTEYKRYSKDRTLKQVKAMRSKK
jgi:hypothetical protein